MRTLLECYKILEEYPNGMTKDQFYRVARINKQHAKYLLDSGLVPCINTGKKTRKYHIATHDVITYLCDREDNPEKYKVPMGFYIGKNGCSKRHPDKPAAVTARRPEPVSDTERKVLACIGPKPVGLEELCVNTGLPTAVLLSTLMKLELSGRVFKQPGQRYVLR